MPNSAKVQFNIKNFTPGVSNPMTGIYYVQGLTKRGPVENPEDIISGWSQFERLFGGLMETSNFPLLVKRALARGAKLRVSRTDAVSTAAVKCTLETWSNAAAIVDLFTAIPKYKGADYNNISIEIVAGNPAATAWTMLITHANEPELNEAYYNIPGFIDGTADTQTCLDEVKSLSKLLDFTYLDATGAVTFVPVVEGARQFADGVDPTGHVATDYSASFNVFDDYDDGMIMAVPEIDDDGVNGLAATYALARGDLVFFAHLPNSITTASALITERTTVGGNNKHIGYFGGGIRVRDERTLQPISISEMGDVLGIAAYVHGTYWPWYSLAGKKGIVEDAIGVVNNFGTPGGFNDLNLLAGSQINMMVMKNGQVQLAGNFSGQLENNQEKFMNVVFLIIWMKRVIKPILEDFLEEPNDTILFKKIYLTLKPLLDKMASPDYRAIYKYEYYGDQNAKSLDDLQLNDKTDVQQGKYKINLKIWAIPSLQELTFNLMLVQGEGVFIE